MADFVLLITDWYRQNARDLPWRRTKNPYFIWLSEVILQQTRVDQGMNYYLKFVSVYPTVTDLANAPEDDVLKLWQGLGYYSRARNLHKTAKIIQEHHNGTFPTTYNELLQLKGIGPYTAAAIASFAFKEQKAVVDGNVFRVLSRHFAIDEAIDSTQGKKTFEALANSLIPSDQPDTFNQAIMEFGALQCTPKTPNCEQCVFQHSCLSFGSEAVLNRPFKSKKTKVRKRYFNYFVFENEGSYAFKKRETKDIWMELYEFPMLETENAFFSDTEPYVFEDKHILSHQHIHARLYRCSLPENISLEDYVFTTNLDEFPTHRLMEKMLEKLDL